MSALFGELHFDLLLSYSKQNN